MEQKEVNKSKRDKKIYILVLLLLIVAFGIWKCPRDPEIKSIEEIHQNKDSLQLASSINEDTPLLDTTRALRNEVTTPAKEEGSKPLTTDQEEAEDLKTIPLQKKVPPISDKEKKETIPETTTNNPEIIVQKVNKSIDNASPTLPKNQCTTHSILKIDKSSFQRCIAFSPDGSKFTVGNNNKFSSVFNIDGKELFKLMGHKGYILATSFSPDGKYIVTGSADKTAKLWGANSGKLVKSFEGHQSMISSVDFSPNGQYIITGSVDSSAIVWNINSGNKRHHLKGHKLEVTDVVFSPNSQYVLTSGADKTAKLWELNSGKILFSLEHENMVSAIAFSPNGKFIITACGDKNVRVWNAQSGKHIRTMKGHKSGIRSVAISADGQQVLTASGDKTVRLWDLKSGVELCTLEGHSSAVNDAACHPITNNMIVSVGNDKTIRMWKIDLE